MINANTPVIVWLRRDLRLTDNPALSAAARSGRPIVPIFVLDEESTESRALGAASRWWLHHSLQSVSSDFADRGAMLVLRRGPAADVLAELIAETGAGAVYWNRCYEPATVSRDTAVKSALFAAGIEAESFNAAMLNEPWSVMTQAGSPYRVFTKYWKACRAVGHPSRPLPPISLFKGSERPIPSDRLGDWDLVPRSPDWASGFRGAWCPGEAGAWARLDTFLETGIKGYARDRDRPDRRGTSAISPHLRFGEIGPRSIWHAVERAVAAGDASVHDGESFLRELGWREFCMQLLFHHPDLPTSNLRPEFDTFPWRRDDTMLAAWCRGQTGYPLVDAGMRQLWRTGWMHNRVRMVVASFLIKDLMIDWRAGEAWFWDTLVDADLASNVANWQWVAGCGADAAPFFRIFNPVKQGEKFDPAGAYVRHWVPEIARLPDRCLHAPWTAPSDVLASAGIRLSETYPRPIVDHGRARSRALEAFRSLRGGSD